jgi:hypothetical protein
MIDIFEKSQKILIESYEVFKLSSFPTMQYKRTQYKINTLMHLLQLLRRQLLKFEFPTLKPVHSLKTQSESY